MRLWLSNVFLNCSLISNLSFSFFETGFLTESGSYKLSYRGYLVGPGVPKCLHLSIADVALDTYTAAFSLFCVYVGIWWEKLKSLCWSSNNFVNRDISPVPFFVINYIFYALHSETSLHAYRWPDLCILQALCIYFRDNI